MRPKMSDSRPSSSFSKRLRLWRTRMFALGKGLKGAAPLPKGFLQLFLRLGPDGLQARQRPVQVCLFSLEVRVRHRPNFLLGPAGTPQAGGRPVRDRP